MTWRNKYEDINFTCVSIKLDL